MEGVMGVDLRKRRSIQLLWKALFELMTVKKMGFSKITVDHICENAMVHRSTFYKHFDDKFRLLEYGLNQLMERYWEIPLEKRILNPFFWSNHFFEGSESHQLIRAQRNDELFFDSMNSYSMSFLRRDALMFIQNAKPIDIPHDLLAIFHVSTMVALSEWWRNNPDRASLTQMDQYFNQLVNENIFRS
ncbi:hypothetical protein ET33_27975 [Paenibacillus tyrfis]|uniref:Uncharacterized protein n=1 Tax=Paenibacillus tyrfis TaxID=1501230 RepID=A0A081NUJ5_9BACL|nr:hypothetical protein ET33_27975 [Paenibacillus tyrfis]